MKSTVVECNVCLYWFEAKAEDYFASGFQPSSAVDETSFFLICTDLLDWHNSVGTEYTYFFILLHLILLRF